MRHNLKYYCILSLALLVPMIELNAQIDLVKKGKPFSRIIVANNDSINREAAELLQNFVEKISGATLPILNTSKVKQGDVIIGMGETSGLSEDGFRLSTEGNMLKVSSGGDKGTIYGIVTLLEEYLGVDCFTSNVYVYQSRKDITIPEINRHENPTFRYRQTNSYALREDPLYKLWFRLEEPNEVFADNLWVHTFGRLLPAAEYGRSHPEYYSYINGERRPGSASQLCLTNPEVFEIVANRIDSIFKANPGKKMISVSQNDGNKTNCQCPTCMALDEQEGGTPSGSLIHFINKLAARFPDKEFSTLAYLHTMHPPKHVKPLPNVNIMLCDIDCRREVPLTDNTSGQDFMQAIEGWSRISNNIFVWDYGINFDCYLSPFPNFPILKKNMELFKDHHVTMHFSQTNGAKFGTFTEMRAYIISKLMWNIDQDTDALMKHFMEGYYGAAAPYLYQYEKLLEGALLGSQKDLWIFDSPVSHIEGMFNTNCLKRYDELFDKAEKAVSDNAILLDRVRTERLSLQYTELEIARAKKDTDLDDIKKRLALFKERISYFGVESMNERLNSPIEYCDMYEKRFLPKDEKNLAANGTISWIEGPTGRYAAKGAEMLTDGLYGSTSFVESWVGWEGKNASFIIDLKDVVDIHTVETDFLHQLGQWVFAPKKISYYTSEDNDNYSLFGTTEMAEDRSIEVKFKQARTDKPEAVKARYVRIDVEGINICPSWHPGVGHKAWFFMDEVRVF